MSKDDVYTSLRNSTNFLITNIFQKLFSICFDPHMMPYRCPFYVYTQILAFPYLETEELLQTTNLHNSKTNHFDSINCRKSLVINGSANSNCSLIDDKQTVQSGENA